MSEEPPLGAAPSALRLHSAEDRPGVTRRDVLGLAFWAGVATPGLRRLAPALPLRSDWPAWTLECSARTEPGRLLFAYALTNRGDRAILAVDRLATARLDGGPAFQDENVFVGIESTTLRLGKVLHPAVTDAEAAWLRPGECLERAFWLPVPIVSNDPDGRGRALVAGGGEAAPIEPRLGSAALFRLGVIPGAAALTHARPPLPRHGLARLRFSTSLLMAQVVAHARVLLPDSVSVFDYAPLPHAGPSAWPSVACRTRNVSSVLIRPVPLSVDGGGVPA